MKVNVNTPQVFTYYNLYYIMKVEIIYLSGFIDKSYNYANFVNFRVKTPSPTMSASPWDQSLASADGLLTNEECSMLLEIDLFGDDNGAFT